MDIQQNTEADRGTFNPATAAAALKIARLPEIFEAELEKGPPEKAKKAVMDNLPSGIQPENVFILQRDNITAIVIYDPKACTATIAFDPTNPAGSFPFNADKRDNFARSAGNTALGADAHEGLLRKMIEKDDNGITLINRLEGVLHDLSSRQDNPLTVNFTGFSKGGSQAMLAAGEMIGGRLFEDDPQIKLGRLDAFSPVAFVSPAYIEIFNKHVSNLGGHATTYELEGDKNPTILTPQADGMFTRYGYGHVGTHIYLRQAEGQTPPEAIVSPDPQQLTTLRGNAVKNPDLHNSTVLLSVLESFNPSTGLNLTPAPATAPAPLSYKY